MLIVSAIITSMDSFLIGFSLKKDNYIPNYLKIWFLSYIILSILLILFSLFRINIYHPFIKFTIFTLLGISCLKKQDETISKDITEKRLFMLLLANSIDGFIIAATFLEKYSLLVICLLFSSISTLFLYLGYKLEYQKKNTYISALIYFLLAFWSLF